VFSVFVKHIDIKSDTCPAQQNWYYSWRLDYCCQFYTYRIIIHWRNTKLTIQLAWTYVTMKWTLFYVNSACPSVLHVQPCIANGAEKPWIIYLCGQRPNVKSRCLSDV